MERKFSTKAVIGLVLATMLVSSSTAAVANHVFPDVSTDAWFHDAVDNVVGAGCATGFNNGTFGPTQNTTRGQFAVWMNRCGTRTTRTAGGNLFPTSGQQLVGAQVEITSGAAASPNTVGGFVVLDADVTAHTNDAAACPCFVSANLVEVSNGNEVLSANGRATIPQGNTEIGQSFVDFPVQVVVPIPAETTRTYGVQVTYTDADVASVTFFPQLRATYVPFGPDGGNALNP